MTRETRFNLIFLAILLVLLVPGAVILFRKKMEPTVRPMYLPDPVRRSVAYMSPEETPPGMARVAPQHTAQWTAGLLAEMGGAGERPRDEEGLPLTSQPGRWFEVLSYRGEEGRAVVFVATWALPPGGSWSIDGRPAMVTSATQSGIPRLVREELGANGLLTPPKHLSVVRLRSAAGPGSGGLSVTYVNPGGQADTAKIVTSFTSPATTSN